MSSKQQATLIAHGALVFLLGMAAGFPLAFEILGRIEMWPVPGSVAFEMPGDVRGWRMAHLEGVLNGILLIAVGGAGERLQVSERGAAWVTGGLLACAWGNILASWIAPFAGVRGLNFSGLSINSLVYLLFMVAVVGALSAMSIVFLSAVRRSRD